MVDVIILALALSMDAFAVAIGLGSKHQLKTSRLALMSALYFGFFQGLMPLLGYMGGRGVLGWVQSYASWIAFLLLLLIGAKMIYEAFAEGIEEDIAIITHRVMLMLAIATSIDALAAGFSLTVLAVNPFVACLIIGLVTFGFSWLGVFVGAKTGTYLESKAELLGGIVLIAIGFKILLL
ncbi:manganese efflux pump MntP family protein [Dasania sp. GY-MA-18]|uniref:Putative manganese efflux pump MntP n=1 Tax=Dasania phycosphaerae TaxID=2950436 RepID=A0A9J6RJT2_9GAMM|nr:MULTISPECIES: manganese efflux pump MntP family protein [Dasania]MCR8922060.1 manganese efflux pump MntP family protein [Dasania sp. GY-MA-18]MCZ0864488.1 manganese efflux pump MntP family protein [Dasania phycosphaerae]MCZ0868216.1 manganese efflux pump MntP family protein [Dasania phycosphaerae]